MSGTGRALIIGGGFIGCHAARAAAAAGIDVRILTRSQPEGTLARLIEGIPLTVADAADDPAVATALDGGPHVVYAAGGLMPGPANDDPIGDARRSIEPLLSVLRAMGPAGSPGITFVSSGGTVYGPPSRLPIPEDHPTDPISAYGVSKLASEKYVAAFARHEGFTARILRCANVYGEGQPTDRGQGAVAAFTDALLRDRPVRIFGDGSIVRDYVYVGDVASALVESIRRTDGPRIMNVGSGIGTSLKELLTTLEAIIGHQARVEHLPARSLDVQEVVLDIGLLRGWTSRPPTPLDQGLRLSLAGSRGEPGA